MTLIKDICTDFEEWPSRWMGIDEDLVYGKKLLEEMRPFAAHLISSGLSKKTIDKHLENLWLLGGEIIRDISLEDKYHLPACDALEGSVDKYGGMYCRHLDSEGQQRSYDSTCKKLAKFLDGSKIG